ncbi:MAG: 4Fe-4S dicluster domain-containing protein [Thermaerobacter sp.]|nr:4Fe-4S dicluster domain-containing protein [Thermaerobacter sp.]
MRSEAVRAAARRLLKEGKVVRFLGHAPGFDPTSPFPQLITRAEEAERLVLDHFCAPNLAKYLLDYETQEGVTAVVLKGCDALGLARLLADHRVARDRVWVVGLPCPGMLDRDKAAALLPGVQEARAEGDEFVLTGAGGERRVAAGQVLLDRCLVCAVPTPDDADELLGEPVPGRPVPREEDAAVAALEAMTSAERKAYWTEQFSRCIRCMACRNVCPACNCRSCCFDSEEPRWLSRVTDGPAQEMFHFVRALHVAGRCVDCHECERVCPMDIPLMKLNHKLLQDVEELFELERAFVPREVEPLGIYRPDDPEEFA